MMLWTQNKPDRLLRADFGNRNAKRGKARRAIFVSAAGTIIEWYDFYIYGAASALIFNKLFFPGFDPFSGLLASYGAYAVGFFVRPIGALIFAHYGDVFGRKPILVATLLLMGLSTGSIGLLPTFESVGLLAPLLLIFLRILQGLGAGAEFSGAVLVAVESTDHRKGILGSAPAVAIDGAIILSTTALFVLSLFPEQYVLAWAWRIPFLLSFLGTAAGYFIRTKFHETDDFIQAQNSGGARFPIRDLIRTNMRAALTGIGINVIMNVGYIYQVYALSYITRYLGLSQWVALKALMISAAVGGAASCFWGALSDRIGRSNVMLFGALFTIAYAFPFFWLLRLRSPIAITIALTVGLAFGLRPILAVQPAFYSELFPARWRFSGVALSREISGALIGGPLPFVAVFVTERYGDDAVAALMVILASITGIALAVPRRHCLPEAD